VNHFYPEDSTEAEIKYMMNMTRKFSRYLAFALHGACSPWKSK
jgi:hypothetical protein